MIEKRPRGVFAQRLRRLAVRFAGPYALPDVTEEVPGAARAADWNRGLADLLCRLGGALLQGGELTSEVMATLGDVAARYGVRARCFVVPTGLFVRVGEGDTAAMDFVPVTGDQLRLDQVQELYSLVRRLRARTVPIDEAREALARVVNLPTRLSPVTSVAGYAILTVGLGLLQHPTPVAVLGWAALGAVVGVLQLLGARFRALATAMPVVAAAAVTWTAMRWAGPLLDMNPEDLLIPPLIAFLPGAALTMGTIELATGAIISGMARLASAANVLLLLAFGILVGSTLASGDRTAPLPAQDGLGGWAPWIGVLLLGLGFLIFYSARPRVLPWLLACLLLERAVQVAGAGVAGGFFGAFAAGLIIPVVTMLVERRTDTPSQVLYLPSFWMLVPGATGLAGVSELISGQDATGLANLLETVITMVSIALGIMVGASLLPRTRVTVADVSGDQLRGTSDNA
ncbi:threonine/serine exporter ThrE family protein [Nonomuraea sp. NPDC050663]|uniref:threonine/serine exporter ThrE family protein n=1 Tax=Nonomuraea sp. NPDC050663 TaxID=3364370 RepID=UPI00379E2322